eukprot:COSAG02_NODE_31506_length_532_cov_1.182448_1_plen_73_part_10
MRVVTWLLCLLPILEAGEEGERCLQRITNSVARSLDRPVVFEMDNWPSQRLVSHAVQILLRDQFGINTSTREY